MAVGRQVDLLEPMNLAEHLDKVELYLGQVCQIAGISKMQLDYWTNKAQIPTKGKKQRIYDIDALETVMLIKQAQGQGPEPRRRDRRRAQLPRSAAVSASTSRPAPPAAPRPPLRRQRIDVDACAELDPAEDGQPRQDLECQWRGIVQPRVPRHVPLDRTQAADDVREQVAAPAARRAVVERAAVVGARRDEQLVRERARPSGRRAHIAALGDRAAVAVLARAPRRRRTAMPAPAGAAGGSSSSQTSCECECGRVAPAARPSLTSAWRYPLGSPAAAPATRSATSATSSSSSSANERTCRGAWTTTSCRANAGIEVRDDAHAPAGPSARLARRQRERLGRRRSLASLAERALARARPRVAASMRSASRARPVVRAPGATTTSPAARAGRRGRSRLSSRWRSGGAR